MILLATLLSSVFMCLGFGVLWLCRKRPANTRRLVCICSLIVCALTWAFALVPATWLPQISSPMRAAVPEVISKPVVQRFTPALASPTPGTEASPARARGRFDWRVIAKRGLNRHPSHFDVLLIHAVDQP